MITKTDDNIFGFYASFQFGETEKELVKKYLWGENGLNEQLMSLKSHSYGQDFHLILFQFYVNPIPYLRDTLKEIGNYRRKEKSIGIPIILEQDNFFKLTDIDKQKFLYLTILQKLEFLREKIKRNKLDLDLDNLKTDTERIFRIE